MNRALTALLVVLLGAAGFLGFRSVEAGEVQDARDDAVAVAERAVAAVLSYDHRTVEQDLAAGKAYATGDFLDEYRAATADLAEQAERGQVVVAARVLSTAVVDGDGDRVVVLVFADQSTTRKDAPEPRLDQVRLRLTMLPVDGSWRIAELDRL